MTFNKKLDDKTKKHILNIPLNSKGTINIDKFYKVIIDKKWSLYYESNKILECNDGLSFRIQIRTFF